MSVIFVLMGFGVLVAGSFLIAFVWAVRTGQFEDRHTPAMRILFEDGKEKDNKPSPVVGNRNKRTQKKLVLPLE
ncbi:MAG TPA: cbb3-type cytochrome oxidase assembly protein CcoS [Bacteroidetes bacterium]|jgi:cbb3-type cytochrome oxidase maturation protein|nr:cbb3-type cytochrome oxidase assembly protein CcoS [Bacteroidota bacterium]